MRIGIDLRPLQGETRYRGIGKTLEFFLRALSALPEQNDHSFIFYIDSDMPMPDIVQSFAHATSRAVKSPKLGRKRYFRSFLPAYLAARPSRKEVDVFLQFDVALGIPRGVPTIAIFYDLIPLLIHESEKKSSAQLPLLRQVKDRLAQHMYWRKYLRFLKSFESADHLIAISRSSKKDLLEYMPTIKENSVSVVPLGVDRSFFKGAQQPSREFRSKITEPYLLFVGGIDTRKNVVELIKLFYALKPNYPTLRLMVVGKEFALHDQLNDRGWFTEINKNKSYSEDIVLPGFVNHEELLYLYRHAACFVFPSLYEGFGLPILEAMAAGCPVVAYDNSSIPEVAGDACLLIETGASMVKPVSTLLENPGLRAKYAAKGKRHAAKFSWDNTAREILKRVSEYENNVS